jgi:two-component system sensor histidine kinase DegS
VRDEITRELHDQVVQTLSTLVVQMEVFKRDQVGRNSVQREVRSYQDATRDVLENVRQMLYDLRREPSVDVNFVDNLRTGLIKRFREQTGITTRLKVSSAWPRRLNRQVAVNLYRILQEALNNACRHSGASKVSVSLSPGSAGTLVLVVADNGRGMSSADERMTGLGLIGMRERATLLGGELEVEDRAAGTTIRAIFPTRRIR